MELTAEKALEILKQASANYYKVAHLLNGTEMISPVFTNMEFFDEVRAALAFFEGKRIEVVYGTHDLADFYKDEEAK